MIDSCTAELPATQNRLTSVKILFNEHLRTLNDLSSDRLVVEVSAERIVLRWSAEVSVALFEACCGCGGSGGAVLDADARTLVIPLQPKTVCKPGRGKPDGAASLVRGYWCGKRKLPGSRFLTAEDYAQLVAVYPHGDFDYLVDMAKGLRDATTDALQVINADPLKLFKRELDLFVDSFIRWDSWFAAILHFVSLMRGTKTSAVYEDWLIGKSMKGNLMLLFDYLDGRQRPEAWLLRASILREDFPWWPTPRGSIDSIIRDNSGQTAFLRAVVCGCTAAACDLLDQGADPTAVDRAGQGAIHLAAADKEATPVLQALLDRGLPWDVRDKQGRTPLYMAVARGNWEAVEVLTRHGARIESLDAEVDALVAEACRKSEEAERETARVLAPAKAFRDAKLVNAALPAAETSPPPSRRL